MVRTLDTNETRDFLSRHPEIDPTTLPTYGVYVYEGDYKYLVALRSTGEVVVIDITAWDGSEPINQTTAQVESSLFDLWGVVDPVSRSWSAPGGLFSQITSGASYIGIALLAVGGLWLYSQIKSK